LTACQNAAVQPHLASVKAHVKARASSAEQA